MDAKYCLRLWERQQPRCSSRGCLPPTTITWRGWRRWCACQHRGLPVDAGGQRQADDAVPLAAAPHREASWPAARRCRRSSHARLRRSTSARPSKWRQWSASTPRSRYTTDEKTLLGINTPGRQGGAGVARRVQDAEHLPYALRRGRQGGLVHDGLLHPVIGTTGTRTWRTNAQCTEHPELPQARHQRPHRALADRGAAGHPHGVRRLLQHPGAQRRHGEQRPAPWCRPSSTATTSTRTGRSASSGG